MSKPMQYYVHNIQALRVAHTVQLPYARRERGSMRMLLPEVPPHISHY